MSDEGRLPEGVTDADIRILVGREKDRLAKRDYRSRQAQERAQQAMVPNPDGYVIPPMPAGLKAQRKWLRDGHDAYSKRLITILELTEMRRSVASQADTYRAGAVVRQSIAATRAAAAQERMADTLATLEHGGAAVALLARLRGADGLLEAPRRPLPMGRGLAQKEGA